MICTVLYCTVYWANSAPVAFLSSRGWIRQGENISPQIVLLPFSFQGDWDWVRQTPPVTIFGVFSEITHKTLTAAVARITPPSLPSSSFLVPLEMSSQTPVCSYFHWEIVLKTMKTGVYQMAGKSPLILRNIILYLYTVKKNSNYVGLSVCVYCLAQL